MAFILILSPSNAPPVLRFDGSTEIIPMVFSGKSIKKRRTNSSTKDDFPDPESPVHQIVRAFLPLISSLCFLVIAPLSK